MDHTFFIGIGSPDFNHDYFSSNLAERKALLAAMVVQCLGTGPPGPNPVKIISSLKLFYAGFQHSDWMK